MNRRLVATVALLFGFVTRAAADPAPTPAPDPAPAAALPATPSFAHLHSPRFACLGTPAVPTDCLQLPAGYFLDEPTYSALDTALRGLQDDQTRLTAENTSLKASVADWQPGWKTIVFTFLAGAAAGAYLEHKL